MIEFRISQTPERSLQLSIDDEAGGFRIGGPKFDGRSKVIWRKPLNQRAIDEIRNYLDRAEKKLSATGA